MQLVLASASPRRKRLLEQAGFEFVVDAPQVAEVAASYEAPHALTTRLALQKVLEVARRRPDACVLGADTVVVSGAGVLLGKPRDRAHAAAMLALLQSRVHFVTTGVAVRHPGGACFVESQTSRLILREGPHDAYLDSGQWQGKAGAYGIQDALAPAVLQSGRLDTVIGLPVCMVADLLERCGVPRPAALVRGAKCEETWQMTSP